MKQADQHKSAYSSKFVYLAIRAALILAILSILINTYVLWNVYHKRDSGEDPAVEAVAALGGDLSSRLTSIEQRLVTLELKIQALPQDEVDLTEFIAALAQINDLEVQLNELTAAVSKQQEQSDMLAAVIFELQQSITTMHAALLAELAELEVVIVERLESLGEQKAAGAEQGTAVFTIRRGDSIWALASHIENPPSQELIDRIIEVNKIDDPRKLQIGQVIVIPES